MTLIWPSPTRSSKQNLLRKGREDKVIEIRHEFQEAMCEDCVAEMGCCWRASSAPRRPTYASASQPEISECRAEWAMRGKERQPGLPARSVVLSGPSRAAIIASAMNVPYCSSGQPRVRTSSS
jgi:hypothetical protein